MKLFNQYLYLGLFLISLFGIGGCTNSSDKQESRDSNTAEISKTQELTSEESKNNSSQTESSPEKLNSKADFPIPEGYIVFDEMQGDLTGDGLDDYILIIKGTDKEKIIQDEYRGELDRNRRGILIFSQKNGEHELITKNLDCFSSENEDGGVYFPPELSTKIEQGKLFVHYDHGRYGNWKYTFRHKNDDFELIGYDSSDNRGPIINRETSINFLTKKKQVRENVNENTEESGDEVFEETWEGIEIEKLFQLSEIEDFDSLEFY